MKIFVIIKYFDTSYVTEVNSEVEGCALINEAEKAWPDFISGTIISGEVTYLKDKSL